MININSNYFRMSPNMLEPHVKYLYGLLNNLFCLINYSQHCAKTSSCTIFNRNAMKQAFVRPDEPLARAVPATLTPRAPLARAIARSGSREFSLTVARLACCGHLVGPSPPHQFVVAPIHVALKA
jgi:hypothetical protein